MHTSLLLEMAAEAMPDRPALGPRRDAMTYGALWNAVRAGAAWLERLERRTIVHVGLNSTAVPLALFASGVLARPFAPLNYRLSDEDLRRLLSRTAPSTAIVDDDMMGQVAGVEGVDLVPRSAFEAACAAIGEAGDPPIADPDIAVLLFTSGTTGEPKAAILRHRHLAAYVISTVEFAGARADEAALVSVPPYHIAGVSAALTGVYGGRRLVHLPPFTPEAWVEMALAEDITHAMVVPTMLGRILDVLELRGVDLPCLRALSYGGGRMPQVVIERAMRRLPRVDFVNAYGLTETSSTIAVASVPTTTAWHGLREIRPCARASARWVARWMGWRWRFAGLTGGWWRRAAVERSGSGGSRFRASTWVARRSGRTAGFQPTTAAAWTRQAICSSKVGWTTSSSEAEKTSRLARSRTCCAPTPPSPMSPCWARRTTNGASGWSPSSLFASRPIPRILGPGCVRGFGRPRLRRTSIFARSFRTTIPASCCAGF